MQIFSVKNYILFGVSIAVLVAGYLLLGQGPVYNPLSWTYAPIVLVLAYLVIIPLAILYKDKDDASEGIDKIN